MKRIISIYMAVVLIITSFVLSVNATKSSGKDKKGTIHITFAQNEFIDVTYYKDVNLKRRIKGNECYLNPGDTIYSSKVSLKNSKSDMYEFSSFQVWQFDENGNKSRVISEIKDLSLNYSISKDFKGTEISIMPLGKYSPRKLNLKAYYINNKGEQQTLNNGIWTVDGSTYNEDKGVSPVSNYTVKFNYENYKNDYYFASSVPEQFYNNESENEVVFRESTSETSINDFSVEMHRYITMTIVDESKWAIDFWSASAIQEIKINNKTVEKKDDKIKKIKCGDKIVVRTDKSHRIEAIGLNKTSDIPVALEDGFEYGFIVPKNLKSSEVKLQLKQRNSNSEGIFKNFDTDNASVKILYNGKELEEGAELPGDDEEITIKIAPYAGYYIDGTDNNGELYTQKMKYSEINGFLNAHKAKKYYTITLETKDAYGKCVYRIDGKTVSGTINVKQNQSVELEYTITNDDYKISRAWYDVIGNVFNEKNIVSSIEIDKKKNNSTIKREMFFYVERKG